MNSGLSSSRGKLRACSFVRDTNQYVVACRNVRLSVAARNAATGTRSRRERGGVRGFRQNDSVIPLAATLLADLDTYAAADGRERASLSRIRDFVSGSPNAFSRANPEGHVTASAVVARSRARIIHERLQPSRGSRGFRGRHAPPAHGCSEDTSSDLLCDASDIAVVGLPRPDEKSLAGTRCTSALLDLGGKAVRLSTTCACFGWVSVNYPG
jgi:hypothetical protein